MKIYTLENNFSNDTLKIAISATITILLAFVCKMYLEPMSFQNVGILFA